jgi:hypothetical protein
VDSIKVARGHLDKGFSSVYSAGLVLNKFIEIVIPYSSITGKHPNDPRVYFTDTYFQGLPFRRKATANQESDTPSTHGAFQPVG